MVHNSTHYTTLNVFSEDDSPMTTYVVKQSGTTSDDYEWEARYVVTKMVPRHGSTVVYIMSEVGHVMTINVEFLTVNRPNSSKWTPMTASDIELRAILELVGLGTDAFEGR